MRFAVVLPRLATGGQEFVTLKLIREWIARGVEVDLVVGYAEAEMVERVPANVRLFELCPGSSWRFPHALGTYVLRERPDHLVATGYDAVVVSLFLCRMLGLSVPLTVTIHGHTSVALSSRTGVWNRFKSRLTRLVLAWTWSEATHVIAVSEGVALDLRETFPQLRDRVRVIHNPVIDRETHRLIAAPLGPCPATEGRLWIVFVGRLVPGKGCDILIDAYSEMASVSTCDLIIVGDGPERPDLERRVSILSLNKRVHFVGMQSNPYPWMREARLFVLPSYHEGFGNVLVEALACGTQVVATDCPSGPREILEKGRLGQLVPVGDRRALSEAIDRSLSGGCYTEPELLRERALQFTADRSAARYLVVMGGA